MATHSSILAWKNLMDRRAGGGGSSGGAEETGGSPWGPKESGTTGQLTLTYLLIGPDPKWVDFYLRAFFSTPYL